MITIEKANETLSGMLGEWPQFPTGDHLATVKLAMEALKRVLDVRRFPDASNWKPLPGETEK